MRVNTQDMPPNPITLAAADHATEHADLTKARADEARLVRDAAILKALRDGHDRAAVADVTGLSYSAIRKIDEANA